MIIVLGNERFKMELSKVLVASFKWKITVTTSQPNHNKGRNCTYLYFLDIFCNKVLPNSLYLKNICSFRHWQLVWLWRCFFVYLFVCFSLLFATLLDLRLNCSKAAVISPQKVLPSSKTGWAQDAWPQRSHENLYFHLDISRWLYWSCNIYFWANHLLPVGMKPISK